VSAVLKIALVGCGRIAQAHWQGILAHVPRIQVTAAVDTNREQAEKMAAASGAQAFGSLEEALEKGDFAAVDIMLPHALHEEAAVRAFAARKHVILEKPMSTTTQSCERILAAARTSGKVFMVAEQSQYWPDALAIQKLIHNGILGEPITARAYFGGPSHPLQGPRPWRFIHKLAGGGITMDGGAHWLRPLRMWLGEIDEVVGATARLVPEMDDESLTRALLRFESGALAVFDTLHGGAYHGGGEEFRITGTRGEVIIERGSGGKVWLYDETHPKGEAILEKRDGRMAAFGYELADFAGAVLDGTPLAAPPEFSLGELRTALAIYRSAQTRRWEKVWE